MCLLLPLKQCCCQLLLSSGDMLLLLLSGDVITGCIRVGIHTSSGTVAHCHPVSRRTSSSSSPHITTSCSITKHH
jgi:hypothetical protein